MNITPYISGATGQMRIVLKSANTKIFRALLSLASAALLIRVIGMLNQIIVTARFGEGAAMDAYFVASALPILLASMMDGAIEASIIPVYARVQARGKEQASRLFSTLLNLLLVLMVLLTVFMFVFRQQLVFMAAPALDSMRMGLANSLTPYIIPALLLMVIISYLESILNAEGQFGWPAYAGLLVPLTIAALALVFGKTYGVIVLCFGTITGLCLQLVFMALRVRRARITYRPILDLRTRELGLIMTAAWPVMLAAFISQASPLIDQVFASFYVTGSISALNYALKLISVPTGVVFVSVGRAALPYLSRQAAINDMKAFKSTLRLYMWGVGASTFLISVSMFLLAHPLIQILFQRGAFTADDTGRTATILLGFIIGLTPMSLGFLLAKTFSALGKTRVLMVTAFFSVLANVTFDAIFAHFWQGFGIALATSAVYVCTLCILLALLRYMIGKLDLLAPPAEALRVWRSIRSAYEVHMRVLRAGLLLVACAVAVLGVLYNALYTLRISLGSILVLVFLRYRYALLMAWVMLDVFIGSTIPLFNGNNFDTALTIPVLLLLVSTPLKETFQRLPALVVMLLFLLWIFASIGLSPLPASAFLTSWLLRLDYVAVAILTIQVLTTRKRIMRLIDTLLIICTFICLYGIYGFFTHQSGEVDVTITSLFRIGSIFGDNAPSLALFLTLVIPLAIYRALTLQGAKRACALIVLSVFLITLMLTFTRSASISVPLSILVMCFCLPSRKLKFGVSAFLLVFVAGVVFLAALNNLPVFNRFLNPDLSTLNNRTYLWQTVLQHFDPAQLLGNGMGAADALLTGLGYQGLGNSPHSSQSLFLATLYDHGIIGVILLMAMFITLFVNIFKGMRRSSGEQRIAFAAAMAVLINMIALNLDSNDIWVQGIGIYFWIIIALPFALYWNPRQRPSIEDEVTVVHVKAITPGPGREMVPGQGQALSLPW